MLARWDPFILPARPPTYVVSEILSSSIFEFSIFMFSTVALSSFPNKPIYLLDGLSDFNV